MIVLDPNAVLGSKGLEGVFGGDCLNRRVIILRVDASQATVVVNKDGSTAVSLLGKFAF